MSRCAALLGHLDYLWTGPLPGFKVWGAQYIFRGAISLFYCMFKTYYFINFQRLTGQNIASCVFSVWSHKICDCTGILRAIGSQAMEEDSSAFLKFKKNDDFCHKKYSHKTKSICLFMRFSPQTKKKNDIKNRLPVSRSFHLKFISPPGKYVGHSLKVLDLVQKIWDPFRKLFAHTGVPSCLRAWFQDIFLTTRQCLMPVCRSWFSKTLFDVCLMHC